MKKPVESAKSVNPRTIRPLIFMASRNLGGPGKGLLQFLRCGGMDRCEPTVVGFHVIGSSGASEFDTLFQTVGVRFALVEQRGMLDWALVRQGRALAKEFGSTILQSHGYKPHLLCLFLKYLTGLPWVAFVHGWTAENFKMRMYKLLDKIVLHFADVVVPVSQDLARQVRCCGRGRTTVIPNAVDEKEYDLTGGSRDVRLEFGVGEDECLLGVVGRMSPEKGQQYFVEAMARVARRGGKVKALLIGVGQDMDSLKAQVADLGLDKWVFFAGYHKDMAPFYSAMDCLVMPSLSEGMPNVALEAMLFGKPVIATTVGGIPEVVVHGETGLLVPPRDPGAMSDAIVRLCADSETMLGMGVAGRERIDAHFSATARVNLIVDVYARLMQDV